MIVYHEFEPYYDKKSEILILGSIPSPKSREQKFYYGHPKNRFWQVLASVFEDEVPLTTEDKKNFLTKHHIALWDVLASCDIKGASDSSIKNPLVNDISIILNKCQIKAIYTTGKKAYNLYQKYIFPKIKQETIYLPSTSPANCRIKIEELIKEYQILNNKGKKR